MSEKDKEEIFEDCKNDIENNEENNNNANNNINEASSPIIEDPTKPIITNVSDDSTNEQNTSSKYDSLPYTYKEEIDKSKENSDEDEVEEESMTEEQKKNIEENIVNERKKAGELYKSKDYVGALNMYSTLMIDAQRAGLKEQCCILCCNKGICFNKMNERDKALKAFKKALYYDNNYSKALCNKMLLHNSKEEYLEAYEDFNRLKNIDYKLWDNYRHLENGLRYNAEIKKKQMTDEMLGKLKSIGNSLLGNFGLSLDNFKMTPNQQGGYSIQFNNGK